ncbi:MAG: hypothetical protein ACLUI7_06090 [Coprococcus sp.]
MENDDKRVRKNRKISKDTESDRSRLKNITNKVHPEYEVPKNDRPEEPKKTKNGQKRAEARRKKQHQERRRRSYAGANRNRHSDWLQRAW